MLALETCSETDEQLICENWFIHNELHAPSTQFWPYNMQHTLRWQLFTGAIFSYRFQCKAHLVSTNVIVIDMEMVQGRLILIFVVHILYSQKIWRGIKFGGLAVLGETAKLKSAKIYTACMYVWWHCSRPPNFNPRIHSLGANCQI